MANGTDRETVTIKMACQLAKVTRRTIYNWMIANRVEYIRTAGGSRRIYVDSLFKAGNSHEDA